MQPYRPKAMWTLISALSLVTFLACAAVPPVEKPKPQFALLAKTSPAIYQQLQTHIATALGQENVRIATRSFTRKPTLAIGRRTARSLNIPFGEGRILEAHPEHFDLMMTPTQCYILHRQTQKIYDLHGASCKPLDV